MSAARTALDSVSKLAAIALALILGYTLFASQAPAGRAGPASQQGGGRRRREPRGLPGRI
jgi:hypothetical protein